MHDTVLGVGQKLQEKLKKMTKELFIKCVKSIIDYEEYEEEVYDATNGVVDLVESNQLQNLVMVFIELLNYVTKDLPNDEVPDNLSYFLWETDCGKRADTMFITETKNDETVEYNFSTVEDVWNYLVKEHPEIEDKEE